VALIDELVREGARRMLAEALQAEVDAYIARHAGERDEHGRRLVVRNGTHQPREVLTSAGAVEVVAPRVNDRRTDPDSGERRRFCSAILPPWCRKTPKITEVLPLLYLHGLSSGDFVPALGEFLGSTAGLSAPVITKLTETWKAEQRAFAARDLSEVDYVYLWAGDCCIQPSHVIWVCCVRGGLRRGGRFRPGRLAECVDLESPVHLPTGRRSRGSGSRRR
jgi:transposase-like protein